MRFALLGDHRDGLDFAVVLVESGRHEVGVYSGPAAGLAYLRRHGIDARPVGDLEDALADAALDAVIVASRPALRPGQLRRALQSEHHVLCVHPADPSPDIAYEAAMIQADTGRVLMPLLPAALHLGVGRCAELAASGAVRLLELEIWSADEVLLDASGDGHKQSLPGWDVLRSVGGEIAEVFLHAAQSDSLIGQPLLLSGRFVGGLLFQATYLPNQAEAQWRLSAVTTTGRATLLFAQGFPGPAQWSVLQENGESHTEAYEAYHPWQALLERFELAVQYAALRKPQPGVPTDECLTKSPPVLGWLDELRALELDDAARRSAERGRSSALDLQETTEEASFKGTMTLVGCGLIWLAVIELIASVWVPWLAWLILPVFGMFLLLQALRWIVPAQPAAEGRAKPAHATAQSSSQEAKANADTSTAIQARAPGFHANEGSKET